MPSTHPTHRYFLWLGILLVIAAVAYILHLSFPARAPAAQTSSTNTQVTFPKDAPAPQSQDYVPAQHGFQYLVQYTASGFHPSSLTIKKGETIRFTNTSAATLQLAFSGTQQTPVAHGAYLEHTFTAAGTYADTATASTGSVTVK